MSSSSTWPQNTEDDSDTSIGSNSSETTLSLIDTNITDLGDKINEYQQKIEEKRKQLVEVEKKKKKEVDNTINLLKTKISKLQRRLSSKVKLLEKTKTEKYAIMAKQNFDPRKDYTFYYGREIVNNRSKNKLKLFDWEFDNFVLVLKLLESTGPNHWLLIQNRFYGKLNITPLTKFEEPIGCPEFEFWIGFERLHILTTIRRHELYIELTNYENEKKYARYDNFVVDGKESGYKLSALGTYEGNAGDALSHHLNEKTYYQFGVTNSVSKEVRWWKGPREKGGNLNVPFYRGSTPIIWYGKPYKDSKMMIRLYES